MYQDEIIILRSKLSEAQALLAKTAEERDKALQQLKEYEGNREMDANEKFINAIDPAYLRGYMGINIKSSSSYDPNSAANQVNRLFGMNQQGTEIVRASMFANRYPFEKAFALFGAVEGCGAQIPLP